MSEAWFPWVRLIADCITDDNSSIGLEGGRSLAGVRSPSKKSEKSPISDYFNATRERDFVRFCVVAIFV